MRLRPVRSDSFSPLCPPYSSRPRRGYTLLEILIATTLALMLMAAVTQLLGQLGTSINNSRAILETADSLRAAATRLQLDLDGVTVTMMPPRRVESNEGYFELINGTGLFPPSTFVDSWNNNQPDSSFAYSDSTGRTLGTVGNVGNILMFTTHDAKRPFVGRYTTSYGFIDSAGNLWRAPVVTAIQSDTAEVAWFMRGHNLHRRVLLVVPQATTMLEWGFRQQMNVSSPPPLPPPFYAADTLSNSVSATSLYIGGGFFAFNDISVHAQTKGVPVPNYLLVPNTLGDLTRRECRYAHPTDVFPYDASRWGQLGLPTLYESTGTATSWLSCYTPPATMPRTLAQIDLWSNNPQYNYTDYELLLQQPITYPLPHPPYQILSSDVVLSNVIGFDVKVWDPGAGAYVNLGCAKRRHVCRQRQREFQTGNQRRASV